MKAAVLPSMRQDRVYRKKQLKCFQQTVIVQQGKINFIHVTIFKNFILLMMMILMSVDLYENKNSPEVFFQVNSIMMLPVLIHT